MSEKTTEDMTFEEALQEVTRLEQMFHGVSRVKAALQKAAAAEPILADLRQQEATLQAQVQQLDAQRREHATTIAAQKKALVTLQEQVGALKAHIGAI